MRNASLMQRMWLFTRLSFNMTISTACQREIGLQVVLVQSLAENRRPIQHFPSHHDFQTVIR